MSGPPVSTLPGMDDSRGYACIWEYEVPPASQADFLAHYAPDGAWAKLFRRAPGYLGTELYHDTTQPDRFVTIDHWRTEDAFNEFRREYAAEYEALDRRCARLTRREASLGQFQLVRRNAGASTPPSGS